MLPLDLARRGPDSPRPTALALRQVREVVAVRPAAAPRPVVVLDAGYDPVALAQSPERKHVDFLVRLAKHRVFARAPGPYQGRGAPRKHGPVFKLKDPTTQGEPDRQATPSIPSTGR